MRTLLLAGTSLLALSASFGTAAALPIGDAVSFVPTGSVQTYTVPDTGTWRIGVTGAQGGTEPYGLSQDAVGGYGAQVAGDVQLTQGEVLAIIVGTKGVDGPGKGQDGGAGGGGGTFVIVPGNTVLAAAGGGGGGGSGALQKGVSAENWNSTSGYHLGEGGAGGNNASGPGGGTGGGGGDGGKRGPAQVQTSGGGGGGGANTAGNPGVGYGGAGQGGGYATAGSRAGFGGAGGNYGPGSQSNGGAGGFGGGGGGGAGEQAGGGGGGGFSGGGGGGGTGGAGGGVGGSFIAPATNYTFRPATGVVNGYATLTFLGPTSSAPVPEPASLALFGTGLAGFGLIRRRRPTTRT